MRVCVCICARVVSVCVFYETTRQTSVRVACPCDMCMCVRLTGHTRVSSDSPWWPWPPCRTTPRRWSCAPAARPCRTASSSPSCCSAPSRSAAGCSCGRGGCPLHGLASRGGACGSNVYRMLVKHREGKTFTASFMGQTWVEGRHIQHIVKLFFSWSLNLSIA